MPTSRQHVAAGADGPPRRVDVDDPLGSGGVMLPNHPPLVVAEQFAMLEALHPGRIDLGIGRAPGHRPGHGGRAAPRLRRPRRRGLPRELIDLMGMLGDRHVEHGAWTRFRATPAPTSQPQVVLLGSSGFSAQLAGLLGLRFAFAHHFDVGAATLDAVACVPRGFRPSAGARRALHHRDGRRAGRRHAERAEHLAGPAQLAVLALRTGRRRPARPDEAAATPIWPSPRRCRPTASSATAEGSSPGCRPGRAHRRRRADDLDDGPRPGRAHHDARARAAAGPESTRRLDRRPATSTCPWRCARRPGRLHHVPPVRRRPLHRRPQERPHRGHRDRPRRRGGDRRPAAHERPRTRDLRRGARRRRARSRRGSGSSTPSTAHPATSGASRCGRP